MLVALEPRHAALWSGVAAQLTALGVLAVVGARLYGGGSDAPWWAAFLGATSALLPLVGGLVAAWRPHREDAAPVEGGAGTTSRRRPASCLGLSCTPGR